MRLLTLRTYGSLFVIASTLTTNVVVQVQGCEPKDYNEMSGVSNLPPFSTIITAIDDFDDCPAGVDATYDFPNTVNFKLEANLNATTEIFTCTSAVDVPVVIPYVLDDTLRFRWDPDHPVSMTKSEYDDSVEAVNLAIYYNPATTTRIETADENGPKNSWVGSLDIHTGSEHGALSQVVNHGSTDITMFHGYANSLLEPQFPPQNLTVVTTPTSSGNLNLEMNSAVGLTVDIAGHAHWISINIIGGSVGGTLAGKDNTLNLILPTDVSSMTIDGELNTLNIDYWEQEDQEPIDYCETVTILGGEGEEAVNFCFNSTRQVDTTPNVFFRASLQQTVCGNGGGGDDSSGSASTTTAVTIPVLLAAVWAVSSWFLV